MEKSEKLSSPFTQMNHLGIIRKGMNKREREGEMEELGAERAVVLPVVEVFDSVQGEGYWTGQWMRFIRLAGCNVGRGGRCWAGPSGYEFPCDTDYRAVERVTVEELVERCSGVVHVCVTGGEPMVHGTEFWSLVQALLNSDSESVPRGRVVHVETSGVVEPDTWDRISEFSHGLWVTVSPKRGCDYSRALRRASEVKWLVHHRFPLDLALLRVLVERYPGPFHWVQPVWDEAHEENLRYALELCRELPTLRLSLQVHKWLGLK